MKKRQIAAILMMMTMALSACQATPTEDVIVQKAEQQEKLTQAADVAPELEGENLRKQMNIPETIRFEITDASGKHVYHADDAPVNVPDTDKASTANAIRADFTDEDTKIWTDAIFGDAKVWKTEEYVFTKSDYLEMIQYENQAWEEDKAVFETDEYNKAYISDYEKSHEERIAQMTAEMETAPETAPEPKYETPEYKLVQDSNYQSEDPNAYYRTFDITGEVGDQKGHLSVSDYDWGSSAYYYLEEEEFQIKDSYWKERTGQVPNICKYSEEEAVKLVEDLLEKLQPGNNLTVKEVIPTFKGTKQDELSDAKDSSPESYAGYCLRFVREVNGMTENVTMYSGTDDEEVEASYIPFGYENVEAYVDDNGISNFSWSNRMKAGEVLQENVALIPFEKVQSIIEEQIAVRDADITDMDIRRRVVSVDLGLMCIRKPNDNDSFTMVPVWDVYQVWEDEAADFYADTELTINAVDGSIINRGYRY